MSTVRPYASLLVNKADENITRSVGGDVTIGATAVGTLTLGGANVTEGVILPVATVRGPYADDAAAAAATPAVPVGGIYYNGTDPFVLNIRRA